VDAIAIALALLLVGGAAYASLRGLGIESLDAGIWSQLVLVTILVVWLGSYLFRAVTQTMTYNQQLKDYEEAVLQKRLEAMSPEELAQLQAELEAESSAAEEA